jgi:hypothetical protein
MPTVARIHKPAKTAMQSGRGNTHDWVLEYEPAEARFVEPLMGWTGSRTTLGQLRLSFPSKEAAIAFADKHGIAYEVEEPKPRVIPRRAYADNFSYHRVR